MLKHFPAVRVACRACLSNALCCCISFIPNTGLRKVGNMEFVTIAVWVLCAVVCNNQAKQKGLNVGLWTILGLLFGIFAVIGVFIAKPTTSTV